MLNAGVHIFIPTGDDGTRHSAHSTLPLAIENSGLHSRIFAYVSYLLKDIESSELLVLEFQDELLDVIGLSNHKAQYWNNFKQSDCTQIYEVIEFHPNDLSVLIEFSLQFLKC